MVRVPQVGSVTTTETDDPDTRETTTMTAMMDPQEAVVHGAVREIMDTPVRATAATILTTKPTRSGEEIQAGAPALKGVI